MSHRNETVLCRSYNNSDGYGTFESRMLSKGMQSVQDSLQKEYDEMYEHYQVRLSHSHLHRFQDDLQTLVILLQMLTLIRDLCCPDQSTV